MNSIDFFTAKDNSLTCRFNGVMLHSAYSPQKEAERFVNSQSFPFFPKYIVILEPAIGYCAEYFRKKFPSAKICAVRFSDAFNKFNGKFDLVFNFNSPNFDSQLFYILGEEGLFSSLFFSWPASSNIFQKEEKLAWSQIKEQLELAQTVLFTHNSFSQRWFLNLLNIIENTKTTQNLKKTVLPIVICASGPSLQPSLEKLKMFKDSFFLIAVSSALNPLLKNKLIPDLVISTDGGFWAKKHLYSLQKNEIPLALAIEANCPKKILSQIPITLLTYSDGIESNFIKKLGIDFTNVQRNGTVSGTAAELALNLTENNVFMCGLDLEAGIALQHTEPNILENENSAKDNFFCTKETRISKSRYNSTSLKVYRDWFCNQTQDKWQRFFRLSDNFKYSSELGKIKDVNFEYFEKTLQNVQCAKGENTIFKNSKSLNNKKLKKILRIFIEENKDSKDWLKNNFPLDFLLYERCNNSEEKKFLFEKLDKKNEAFLKKIKKLVF